MSQPYKMLFPKRNFESARILFWPHKAIDETIFAGEYQSCTLTPIAAVPQKILA